MGSGAASMGNEPHHGLPILVYRVLAHDMEITMWLSRLELVDLFKIIITIVNSTKILERKEKKKGSVHLSFHRMK